MTASKQHEGNTSAMKVAPKRAVSFSPNVKPEAPSRLKPKSDGELQAVDKRRRYMRRGSKCPSMLRATFTISPILMQTYAAAESAAASTGGFSPRSPHQSRSVYDVKMMDVEKQAEQQRRMSLMSALKMSLENTTIVDKYQAPKKAERRLSTLNLLSQVWSSNNQNFAILLIQEEPATPTSSVCNQLVRRAIDGHSPLRKMNGENVKNIVV